MIIIRQLSTNHSFNAYLSVGDAGPYSMISIFPRWWRVSFTLGLSSIGSSQRSQLGLTGKTRRSRLLVRSLASYLCLVPFLPFFRVKEVVATPTVGGVYLFAAELWAPFIPRAAGSRISRDVLEWIMGLGSARLERCRGWFELRELDDMATSLALRPVHGAICHGGLL